MICLSDTRWALEFRVMSFGLCNMPSMFQSTIDAVFWDQLQKSVRLFFNNILVFSKSWESHIQHRRLILATLAKLSLVANPDKSEFALQSISYLGHQISQSGVEVDGSKIEAITSWPLPTNIKQLRGFPGLASYYWRFVYNYASIPAPLCNLLCKDNFCWTSSATEAFGKLKTALPHLFFAYQISILNSLLKLTHRVTGWVLCSNKMKVQSCFSISNYLRALDTTPSMSKKWQL